MARLIIISALAMLPASPGSAVTTQSLMVNVQKVANGCYVTLNGVHVTDEALLKSAKRQRGQRAVIALGKDAPYKCVGEAIIRLQQAGIMDIEPIPSLRN